MKQTNRSTTRTITQIAVFTAVSYVLYMFVKFPLPFLFPSFLEIHISDMPALLAGFMMGPLEGSAVIILRSLLKMPFTSTALVGELADLLCGLAFVLPSSLFYKRNRTKRGALISLIIGCAATTAVAMLVNYAILVPFYVKVFFDGDINILVNMLSTLFPSVTVKTVYVFYIFFSVLPFNLLRSLISAFITFILYKRLVKLFDRIFVRLGKKRKTLEQDGTDYDKNNQEQSTAKAQEDEN